MRRRAEGLSLVEISLGLAVAGVIASMALPSYQAQLAKARRSQAIGALTQLQSAQEQFRAQHGSYTRRLEALNGVSAVSQHHELMLVAASGTSYIARATVRAGTSLNGGCQELTLTVADGMASFGPSDRCWNR